MDMNINSVEYDKIAEGIFGPIYRDIAKVIIERTGVEKGDLLDLGCGGGHLGFAMDELGDYTLNFSDIRDEALNIAKSRADEKGIEALYIQSDVHDLKMDDNSFDIVVSRGSMPFWEDQVKAFSEIYRVLRPGAWAYIGGGLGGAKHQKRIRELQKENGGPDCFDRSKSKSLSTESYVNMFKKWGADYKIVENKDEGRWFLFRKKGL